MEDTGAYEGMLAETITVTGDGGDRINAYFARPLGAGPFPAMLLLHHIPGWDEWYKELARRYAHHGYAAIAPDLYCRDGRGTAEDVAAKVRAEGGAPDDRVVGDADGCIAFLRSLPYVNGKVGVMGTCSGGRHSFLVGCRSGEGVDAVVDCWGGNVVMAPDRLTERQPVAPIDHTADLQAPLLGLFGENDRSPTPEEVAEHEAALRRAGKEYEFHMYPDAGHGFFYYQYPQAYAAEAAVDGWQKVWDFLGRHLAA